MKTEIELTDEQYEKVNALKDNGMSVGDAIDALFEMKEAAAIQTDNIIDSKLEEVNREKAELEERLSKLDEDISLFTKLKDTSMDVHQKQKIIGKDYGRPIQTYDETVQNAKHKFKWTKSIFKL